MRASGGAFYILNTSEPEVQAASWKFLRYMLEPENAREWYINGGYLPVDPKIYEDPEVQAFAKDDVSGVLLQASYDQITHGQPRQARPPDRPLQGRRRRRSRRRWSR